jgi:hypothetical protein
MTTLFTNDPSTVSTETTVIDTANALEALVGDGKKFKDAEALAKGKLEADRHIAQTHGENKALRDRVKELEGQLSEKKTMEEFLEEFRRDPKDIDESGTTPSTPNLTTPRPNTEQDIDKLIDEKLEEKRRREAAQNNVSVVANELSKVWGPSYQEKLASVAKELGLSHEFLGGIAEKSPKAFLELVGVNKKAPVNDPNVDVPPRTTLNQGLNLQGTSARNQAFYDKLKKSDPKTYYSEKITAQRHRDAQRMGEAYFS